MESGSSVLPENTGFDRKELALAMTTLDDVSGASALEGPVLLKVDVQGYELEVLRGGAQTLARSEVVLLEVSLLEYNQGAPLMPEVVAFMNAAGFVPYDVCGQFRRETDTALCQIDIMFVRRESALRAKKLFWNRDPAAADGSAGTGVEGDERRDRVEQQVHHASARPRGGPSPGIRSRRAGGPGRGSGGSRRGRRAAST